MQEERRMVLEMLQQGKITAEQAAELLRALEGSASRQSEAEVSETRQTLKTVIQGLDLSGLFSSLVGSGHRFEEVREGELEPVDGVVQVRVRTRNGTVRMSGWDEPGYRAVLKKSVRAPSREEAEDRAAGMVKLETAPGELTVETEEDWPGGGVSVYLYLPRSLQYRVDARTANGSVQLADLRCQQVNVHTANGKVALEMCEGNSAELHTSNGSIRVESAFASVLARTSNGSIRVEVVPSEEGHYDLTTSNGSIKVHAQQHPDLAYEVDAETTMGKVSVDLPDMVATVRERTWGRSSYRGKSRQYETASRKVTIKARTTNGSIRVFT